MKNAIKFSAALLLILLVLGYLFREPLREYLFALLTQDMFVAADNDDFDPGPAAGSHFPGLQATYQGRTVTLINEFAGAHGTLFIASRSFAWCPYCIRQLLQLQQHKADFDAAGIGMVAISYDAPEVQQAFIDKYNITIPLLSDVNALSFKTLGILNEDYTPEDAEYGIAHPGMMIVDTEGRVAGKLFLASYRSRVDAAATLTFAKTVLGISSP
jgi:peroxiredoxin